MKLPGKTLEEMCQQHGVNHLADMMGCTPRNVRFMLAKKTHEFRFWRRAGKWKWIKYQVFNEA